MAKAKKVDLNTISQAHGALPESKSIADIFGYGTGYEEKTIEEYDAKIDALTDSDLHEHAIEVGIVPTSNTVLLKDKLQRQFLTAQSKYTYKTNPNNMSKKNQEILKNFMKGAI